MTEEAPFTSNRIAGARVEFVDGANAGKSATTDDGGIYEIRGAAAGGYTVRVTAEGYREQSIGITLTRDLTQDFALAVSGPRRKFGPGQYRVNTDIAAGRYFSVPDSGCYFERQRGFGGSLADIIANQFIGYDAFQWIVEIKSSDAGFETDEDCGIWYNSPREGAQTSIRAGMWLVGSQITPGRYRASTQPGCYWERLRNFTNSLDGVIDNDFVSGGGAKIVEIRRTDVGFSSDDECGEWTRIASVEPPSEETTGGGDESTIQQNRALARAKDGHPRLLGGQ